MTVTAADPPRRKSVAQEPVTSILSGDVPVGDFDSAEDEVLASLGYKVRMRR
jgi:hypothetical protein